MFDKRVLIFVHLLVDQGVKYLIFSLIWVSVNNKKYWLSRKWNGNQHETIKKKKKKENCIQENFLFLLLLLLLCFYMKMIIQRLSFVL